MKEAVGYFFFLLPALVEDEDLGRSFDKVDLMREALFLWINLFLTARSARETAVLILSKLLLFFAKRTALSSLAKIILLT